MKHEVDARSLALLYDIHESASCLREYTAGVSKAAFMGDRLLQDAVCMRLALIGELAGKLEKPVKGLPVKAMKGLRNRIIHDYGRVDLGVVWKIIDDEMEPLLDKFSVILPAEGFLTETMEPS